MRGGGSTQPVDARLLEALAQCVRDGTVVKDRTGVYRSS